MQPTAAATAFAVRQIARHLPDIEDRAVFARALFTLREAGNQLDALARTRGLSGDAEDALAAAAMALSDEVEPGLHTAMRAIAQAEAERHPPESICWQRRQYGTHWGL